MIRPDSTATTTASPARGADARHPLFITRMRRSRPLWLAGLTLLLLASWLTAGSFAAAQDAPDAPLVYVVPVQGTIEPGIGAFLERSFEEARDAGATTIILDINTPGGRLDTVLQMRDTILDSRVPVIAFVNREAFSAGALITIASNEIWMTPGAVYGAATPVLGGSGETADEKTISAVRSTFRATAEERGRDPLLAEAMVDPAVVVDGLDSATSLLTLTTTQALEWDYADGVAEDIPALLEALGLEGATVHEMKLSPIEQLVRWITDPIFASLLITAGLFLIIADALFAGFGIAAAAGVASLGLFFWGHALAGLAGWEDLLLIALGLALLAAEAFVIPGFGIAGVAGILSLAGGLVMAMSGRGFGNFEVTDEVMTAAWSVVISLGLVLLALVIVSLIAPRAGARINRRYGGLALAATVEDAGPQRTREQPRQSGWLVRRFGGNDVLEQGDVRMPPPPTTEQPGKGR